MDAHPAYLPPGIDPDRFKAVLDEVLAVCEDQVYIYDAAGRYRYLSAHTDLSPPRGPGPYIGRTWREVGFDPEVVAPFEAMLADVLRDGRPITTECDVPLDGRLHRFAFHYAPVHDATGAVVAVVTGMRDVTAVRRAEEALRQSEARWRTIVEHAPGIILTVDRDGRITYINRVYNYPHAEDILGADALSFIAADDRERVAGHFAHVLATGEPVTYTTHAPGPEGKLAFYQADLAALYDGAAIVGLILVATDITAHHRATLDLAARDEALRQADALVRLKNDFVSSVSHELRTPLTTIRGFAEFLEDGIEGPLNPGQTEFLTHIQAATARLERLVDDLLDFSRIDHDAFVLRTHPLDLAALVRTAAQAVVPQAAEAGLVLDVPDMPPTPVRADGVRVTQVMANLLGNAIKFSPRGGTIALSLSAADGLPRIAVKDHGPGIAAEDLPRLFQRFSQLTLGHKQGTGAGLGLSICKSLVEAHGGTIGVESQPGAGATFWFTLPPDGPAGR